jgi:amylosucrase
VGWDGFAHRRFLNDFYSGAFPGSFARGAVFQFNPETGDGRISGSAASLCGIETALESGDTPDLDLACGRLEVVYAAAVAFGGVPLLYMGDEIGLRNDASYLDDPELAVDNRWMHRPTMDWSVAARRTSPDTIEGRLFAMFRSMLADRATTPALHGSARTSVLAMPSPALFGFVREHAVVGSFAMIANFGRSAVTDDLARVGLEGWRPVRASCAELSGTNLMLAPAGYVWLTTN